jgi:hypothetical protein
MWQFYRKWLLTALSHTPGVADLWSSMTGAILGVVVHIVPEAQPVVIDLAWQIPVWTFLMVFLVRLISAPYWIFSQQETALQSAESLLAKIREDRPLSFNGLSLGRCIQPRRLGPSIIGRIGLEFENISDQRIYWHIEELFYKHRGERVDIPPSSAGNNYDELRV